MAEVPLCFLIIAIISIVVAIWGFIEILRAKQPDEDSENATISRQLRGFGYLLLSQVLFVLGAIICVVLAGGLTNLSQSVAKKYF